MQEHVYIVHFIDLNIKILQTSVLGDIAVEKAAKKLESGGFDPEKLKGKINHWRVS